MFTFMQLSAFSNGKNSQSDNLYIYMYANSPDKAIINLEFVSILQNLQCYVMLCKCMQ